MISRFVEHQEIGFHDQQFGQVGPHDPTTAQGAGGLVEVLRMEGQAGKDLFGLGLEGEAVQFGKALEGFQAIGIFGVGGFPEGFMIRANSGVTEVASSSTVSSPVGALSWGRYPIRVPRSHSALPSSDSLSPKRMENKVVLPAPFGPTRPSFSPRIRRREISRKRTFGPEALGEVERVSMTEQKQTGLRIGGFWQRNSAGRFICLFLIARCL